MNFPILSSIIFLPFMGALFIFLSKNNNNNQSVIYVAIFTSVANFFLSLFLWYLFDNHLTGFKFVEEKITSKVALFCFEKMNDNEKRLKRSQLIFANPPRVVVRHNKRKKFVSDFAVSVPDMEEEEGKE